MSKKLLSFMLSELTTVRIICRHEACDAVTEIPLEKLRHFTDPSCPVCRRLLLSRDHQDAFATFEAAATAIRECKDKVEIEFTLPQEP